MPAAPATRYQMRQRALQAHPRSMKLPGLRLAFYLVVYLFTLITGVDLFAFIITAPMLAAILGSLAFTPRDRIGYIDAIAVVYFISFVIVPLQKISHYAFINGEFARENAPYPMSYFLIVAGLALVSYLALVALLRPRQSSRLPQQRTIAIPIPWIFLSSTALVAAAVAVSGSVENVFAPRFVRVSGDYDFVMPVIIALLSINAMFAVLQRDVAPVLKLFTAAFACAALAVVANPLNSARFALLGAWIPVLVCILPALLRPSRFYLVLPAVVLILLPVLSVTTRFTSERYDEIGQIFLGENSIFQISYFNLFELSCEAVRYVALHGHEAGALLVSTVLSLVPRSMWPGKPINSGLLIGYMNVDEGSHNENLAVPFFMDGYIDFGILGAVAYGIVLAAVYVLARRAFVQRVNGFDLYFLVFLANITIMTRGTLAVVYILFLFQLVFLFAYVRLFSRPIASLPRMANGLKPPQLPSHPAGSSRSLSRQP